MCEIENNEDKSDKESHFLNSHCALGDDKNKNKITHEEKEIAAKDSYEIR